MNEVQLRTLQQLRSQLKAVYDEAYAVFESADDCDADLESQCDSLMSALDSLDEVIDY